MLGIPSNLLSDDSIAKWQLHHQHSVCARTQNIINLFMNRKFNVIFNQKNNPFFSKLLFSIHIIHKKMVRKYCWMDGNLMLWQKWKNGNFFKANRKIIVMTFTCFLQTSPICRRLLLLFLLECKLIVHIKS